MHCFSKASTPIPRRRCATASARAIPGFAVLAAASVVACQRPVRVADAPEPAGRVYYLCESHPVEGRPGASEGWTGCEVDQGPGMTGDAVLRYPDMMAAAGVGAWVTGILTIDSAGHVAWASLRLGGIVADSMASVDSTHGALFVAYATHDLRLWRFTPARLGGKPVAVTLPVEIQYAFPPGHDSAARLPLHAVRITDWVRAAVGWEQIERTASGSVSRADSVGVVTAAREAVLAWDTGVDSASVVVRRIIRWTPTITAVEMRSGPSGSEIHYCTARHSAGRWRVTCDRHLVVRSVS
jgi:hypothetical protein